MRGRIVGLEGGLENLHAQHRKLAGRVYADEYHERRRAEQEPPQVDGDVCPNWRTPQFPEGDDCDYCSAMRAQREAALAHVRQNGVTLGVPRAKQ